MSRLPVINFVYLWSNVLPIGSLALRVRRCGTSVRIFFAFFIVSAGTDVASYLMSRRGIHNLWLLDLDNVTEFTILVLFLRSLEPSSRWKSSYPVVWVLFVALWLVAKASFEPFFGLSGYTHSLSQAVVAVYVVHLLVAGVTEGPVTAGLDERFVMLSAILVYVVGSLFLYGFIRPLLGLELSHALQVWQYNWALGTLINVGFTAGFLWTTRRAASSHRASRVEAE